MASLAEISDGLAQVVELVGPSVVRVDGGRRQSTSGVIWAPGIVVCTNHGLAFKEGNTVDVGDGVARAAEAVGHDPSIDLAVLKVEGLGAPARLSDGAGLKVGHLALKLGRPGKTVRASLGIVTALGVEPWQVRGGTKLERYVESSAPHQPGFSGGPLVGTDGAVLGITTTGILRGTSMTVPSGTVTRLVEQLLKHGKVRRSFLGLQTQPVALPKEFAEKYGEEVGLLVSSVEANGPAHQAGIQLGDTVLALGPDTVKSLGDLQAYLGEDHVGETVPAKVLRAGQVVELKLTIGVRP